MHSQSYQTKNDWRYVHEIVIYVEYKNSQTLGPWQLSLSKCPRRLFVIRLTCVYVAVSLFLPEPLSNVVDMLNQSRVT